MLTRQAFTCGAYRRRARELVDIAHVELAAELVDIELVELVNTGPGRTCAEELAQNLCAESVRAGAAPCVLLVLRARSSLCSSCCSCCAYLIKLSHFSTNLFTKSGSIAILHLAF